MIKLWYIEGCSRPIRRLLDHEGGSGRGRKSGRSVVVSEVVRADLSTRVFISILLLGPRDALDQGAGDGDEPL